MRSPLLAAVLVVVAVVLVARRSEAQHQLYLPFGWNLPFLSNRVQDPAPPPPPALLPVVLGTVATLNAPPVRNQEHHHHHHHHHHSGSENSNPPPPKLLDSYYPAAMQLLHYFSERMQYKEFHSTTVAPPYTGGNYEVPAHGTEPGTNLPAVTRPQSTSTTTSTTTTAAPTTTTTTTTRRPPSTYWPPVESTTPVHAPGLFAPIPPQYQMQLDAQVAHDTVHAPTQKPVRKPVTTTTTTTTKKPTMTTTTKKPQLVTRRTTKKPTTTTRPTTTARPITTTTTKAPPRVTLGEPMNFFTWFFENKRSKKQQSYYEDSLYDILDPLPKELLNDIDNEGLGLPSSNDVENLEQFLRKYDDKYGRHVPSQTGEKKSPPTKPYVEFLVLYDLMKREAKSKTYSEYHGFTEEVLRILNLTSYMSSERQLHYVLSQVAAGSEIEANSIKARMETIIKDLENPYSVTAKTLREIPAFVFAL